MTTFDLEDAEALLTQLQRFHETLDQEWTSVLNRWGNLKSVWYDAQFDRFEPYFEKLSDTHRESERECEAYIAFMKEQIQVAEKARASLTEKLGAMENL